MYFSGSCSIQLDDKVVVTGGDRAYDGMSECGYKVSVFDIGGWIEDLPNMSWRSYHGCGHYIDGNNNIVIFYFNYSFLKTHA